MSQYRLDRLQEIVQQEISSILLFDVTDPGVKGVTITRVVMTKDLGVARVYYEGGSTSQERASLQKALDRAKGFIRKQLTPKLNLRSTPQLEFFYDETKEEISRVNRLFEKI